MRHQPLFLILDSALGFELLPGKGRHVTLPVYFLRDMGGGNNFLTPENPRRLQQFLVVKIRASYKIGYQAYGQGQ